MTESIRQYPGKVETPVIIEIDIETRARLKTYRDHYGYRSYDYAINQLLKGTTTGKAQYLIPEETPE